MSENNLPAVRQNDSGYDLVAVTDAVKAIGHLYKEVMQPGVHYGTIPGCGDKPSLLKPGAEKILMLCQLATDSKIERIDLANGHREYQVTVTLIDKYGQPAGDGSGTCSTMESKFRYRWIPGTKPESKEIAEQLKAIGKGKWRKDGNDWTWLERAENDNPADLYNTVLKMADKRALVAAVLRSRKTGASDIFTQDLEDMADNGTIAAAPVQQPKPADQQVQEHFQGEYIPPSQPVHHPAPQPQSSGQYAQLNFTDVKAKADQMDNGLDLMAYKAEIVGNYKLSAKQLDWLDKHFQGQMDRVGA